ncbi:hypothetical protein PR202_ga04044 [Eleusine coracana subsp. coracana]|uniref:RecA family profile 2 domain-containing protein n=1 Tax=Eleusine coracana subsp. coracana TaxID=191504 RepID=A0AAV5BQ67_ELECO|nr:hypothetical protein PR202_ga04044 [Eleusine coracana subsp. coracana]
MAPSRHADEGGQLQLMEADRIEEEEESFESIDKLISQGINAGDVKKLQDAGIYTCNGLMMHTKKRTEHMFVLYEYIWQSLTGIKGLSEAKVEKICEAAEKLLSQGFMTGSDLLIKQLGMFDLFWLIFKRKSVVRITTGSQALDDLLGGGIETLCITEAFGEFRRPERIVPIAERFGMDANAVLDNIIYARAYTYEHQYNLLLGLAAKMAEEPFRLLIVDSVIALFRVDFSGRGELAERQVASEVFGVSRGGKQEAKDTWWWNDKVQRAIKEKKECFKRLHLDKSATNIEGYKIAKRAAKRAVSVAKGQAYDNLYQRLGTKEGEKDIYRMARIRERKTRDINQIKCIKDGVDRLLVRDEEIKDRWQERFVRRIQETEIEEALKRMKSGKAMGPDGIPIEQKLAQMLSRLTKIAEEFNVAVYITNQVIADPGGGMFITDPKKPAGGHVLAHAATIRLMLRKGKGEQRVCKIFDAPNLPEGEAISFCL